MTIACLLVNTLARGVCCARVARAGGVIGNTAETLLLI